MNAMFLTKIDSTYHIRYTNRKIDYLFKQFNKISLLRDRLRLESFFRLYAMIYGLSLNLNLINLTLQLST